MAIVFPASPSVNDTFTAGSITYKWDGSKWIGLGVTPADRLVEGSNSLEITAGNDLVWSGDSVLLGTATANVNDRLTIHDPGSAFMSIRSDVASDGNSQVLDFGVGTADRSSANLTAVIAADIHSTSGGTLKADLVFQTNSGNSIGDRVRITSDGNIEVHNQSNTDRSRVSAHGFTCRDNWGIKTNLGNGMFSPASNTLCFSTNSQERIRVDGDGLITTGGKTASSHGSPHLLLWGADTTLHLTSTGSVNNSSFTGIKFAVAGGSTGDYSKAGIFVQRQDSFNDLDMIFAFRSSNDATGVSISDEKMRINSDGAITKTSNPAFMARYSVSDTVWNVASDGWTKIIFDQENVDKGSNYNPSTSEFTAPVDGMYLFGAELQLEGPNGITSGYLTTGTNWMYISFIVNGATTLTPSEGGTRTDVNFNAMYNSYTPTHLMNLSAGDTVCMYRTGNYTSIKFKGGTESVFWGYLVG